MRSFTTLFAALSLAVLATAPVHADETTMVPPKKPAASAAKPKPAKQAVRHRPARPTGNCMQGAGNHGHDRMAGGHSRMRGQGGMRGKGCSAQPAQMKGMGGNRPATDSSMPMAEHDM